MNVEDALFITTSAAVAVSRAIETCCDHKRTAQIKWVNDIYLDEKKGLRYTYGSRYRF